MTEIEKLKKLIDILKTTNKILKKDNERLTWAQHHPEPTLRCISQWWEQTGRGMREEYFNFREVIDQAMEEHKHRNSGGRA